MDVKPKPIIISILIIALALIVIYCFIQAYFKPTSGTNQAAIVLQQSKELNDYLFERMKDKVYPNDKIYDIKINPPNVETTRLGDMGADETGLCVSCISRAAVIKTINYFKHWYGYTANNYTEALKAAGKHWIEVGPTTYTEGLNDFTYYLVFDDIRGTVKDIKVSLDPSESVINAMSVEQVENNFKKLVEQINVSSTYPGLSGKSDYCFWFHPWQASHGSYDITVPNKMINYTFDGKNKCNITVTNSSNKINIVSDCSLYSDLCPSNPALYDGSYKCDYPTIRVCFN